MLEKTFLEVAKVGKVKKTKEVPSPFLSGEEGGEFFFRGSRDRDVHNEGDYKGDAIRGRGLPTPFRGSKRRGALGACACEEALAILALFEVGANRQRREQLLTQSSVTTLAWFLCKGSLDAKVNAATVLAGIASETESLHNNSIRAMPRVLEALAKLLREEFYPKAIKASLKALLTICIPRRNMIRVAEVGVVPLLIKLLLDAKRSNVELALGVLELLCTTAEGRAVVANHALAMADLVHHLHTVSNLAIELSVVILWSVCKASPACLVVVVLQVKWIRAMYSDFEVFRRDQEMLISKLEDQLHTFDFYTLEWGLLFRKISTYLMPLKVRRSARGGTTSIMEGAENIHLPHQSRQSGLGFPEDSTEKLLGELESTLEKVQFQTNRFNSPDSECVIV